MPDLKREGVCEKMKGFVYALQGIFDNEGAFKWWICGREQCYNDFIFMYCLLQFQFVFWL
jgi:hypothetical protein